MQVDLAVVTVEAVVDLVHVVVDVEEEETEAVAVAAAALVEEPVEASVAQRVAQRSSLYVEHCKITMLGNLQSS